MVKIRAWDITMFFVCLQIAAFILSGIGMPGVASSSLPIITGAISLGVILAGLGVGGFSFVGTQVTTPQVVGTSAFAIGSMGLFASTSVMMSTLFMGHGGMFILGFGALFTYTVIAGTIQMATGSAWRVQE